MINKEIFGNSKAAKNLFEIVSEDKKAFSKVATKLREYNAIINEFKTLKNKKTQLYLINLVSDEFIFDVYESELSTKVSTHLINVIVGIGRKFKSSLKDKIV